MELIAYFLPAASLPLYRNVIDVCTLSLCSAGLLNLCNSSSSVSVESFRFSIEIILLSAKREPS